MRHLPLAAVLLVCWPVTAGAQHEHGHPPPKPSPPATRPAEAAPPRSPDASLPPSIPPVTDADRAAAFPDVEGHPVHGEAINYFVLFDQLEWQSGSGTEGFSWDNKGWIGRDRDRLWFRTEGDVDHGRLEEGQAHLLYGRAVARWWDVVAGVRQDFRPGPAQTWAAVGVQGLAPGWFEVEVTGYVGGSGRTHLRLETEYELLLTNRLMLQPLVEVEIYGKDDPERGIGNGLSSGNVGLRLRYEIRREFAPYLGVVWNRKFFGTRDLALAAGDPSGGARLVLGARVWR